MRLRCLELFVLFLPNGARRSIHIDDSHQRAQQQKNTLANGLEVSAEAREAFIPGGFRVGALRRAGLRAGASHNGFKQVGQRAGIQQAMGDSEDVHEHEKRSIETAMLDAEHMQMEPWMELPRIETAKKTTKKKKKKKKTTTKTKTSLDDSEQAYQSQVEHVGLVAKAMHVGLVAKTMHDADKEVLKEVAVEQAHQSQADNVGLVAKATHDAEKEVLKEVAVEQAIEEQTEYVGLLDEVFMEVAVEQANQEQTEYVGLVAKAMHDAEKEVLKEAAVEQANQEQTEYVGLVVNAMQDAEKEVVKEVAVEQANQEQTEYVGLVAKAMHDAENEVLKELAVKQVNQEQTEYVGLVAKAMQEAEKEVSWEVVVEQANQEQTEYVGLVAKAMHDAEKEVLKVAQPATRSHSRSSVTVSDGVKADTKMPLKAHTASGKHLARSSIWRPFE